MTTKNNDRIFFVYYSNGDSFYFTVNIAERKISCIEFQKMHGKITNQVLPPAAELEIVNNSFNLKTENGNILYSLERFNEENARTKLFYQRPSNEPPTIERIYMDEDFRQTLLSSEMIKYDSEASKIPGLLCEPVEEVKSHTRVRCK